MADQNTQVTKEKPKKNNIQKENEENHIIMCIYYIIYVYYIFIYYISYIYIYVYIYIYIICIYIYTYCVYIIQQWRKT